MAKTATLKPTETPHAFTVKQWHETPELQRQLQAALDLPIVKMAFQTILMTAMPSAAVITQLVPGVSAEAMAYADAQRYHHRSGMTQTYRALRSLARAPKAKPKGAEWGERAAFFEWDE